MTIHTNHDNIHNEGLADGCPRCEEHGEKPFNGLDDRMLGALVLRVEDWDNSFPRSANEATAMRVVERSISMARVLVKVGWRP